MYTGVPAVSFSILATRSSAGGQLEQPSEVKSSTTAKPFASALAFFKSFKLINPVEASAAAVTTTARDIILNHFICLRFLLRLPRFRAVRRQPSIKVNIIGINTKLRPARLVRTAPFFERGAGGADGAGWCSSEKR